MDFMGVRLIFYSLTSIKFVAIECQDSGLEGQSIRREG